MATLKGTYAVDQTVIGKIDKEMENLMKAAKEASEPTAEHDKMHTAWRAVHDVLHALYMKPNPKPKESPTVTTSNEGAETKIETGKTVDTLPAAETTPKAAAAAAATTPKATTPKATTGGGHCNKKSKRRRRKGRKGRRATKKND